MLRYTVLSGFLGSGKTTLLRRTLAAHADGEVAVIVNELAPSGVDAHLIADACAAIVEIAGGCACCDKRPELVDAMRCLLDRHERGRLLSLKHVVIETSGLADPLPIAVAVATDPVLRHHFELSSVVTVVDGLGEPSEPGPMLRAALTRDFGSYERWHAEFAAMGKALGGGSGWVLLSWSPRDRKLVNQWAADHCHTLAGGTPILALDMYEHSYHMDFGAKAAAYVDAFMANINWDQPTKLYALHLGKL